MNTRFYPGPINSGMGRRWDDWPVAGATAETSPPRGRAPVLRPTPPTALPDAATPDARRASIDAIARRR